MTGPALPAGAFPAFNAETVDDDAVILITITDTTLVDPLLLSSHPSTRISVDPLSYGTISNGDTYEWALLDVPLPDDRDDGGPRKANVTIDNVTEDRATIFRNVTDAARVTIAVVLASAPDDTIQTVTNLRIVGRSYTAQSVTLELSAQAAGISGLDPAQVEPWPAMRQTWQRAPGLHR
jgi:hypothetical protein